MNVLYITNYGTLYGANRSLLNMMIILRDKYNVQPVILISGAPGPMGDACIKNKIDVISHDFRNRTVDIDTSHKWIRKKTRFIMRYMDILKLYFFLRKKVPDIDMIHSNSSIFDIGFYLSKMFRIPHVWHIREFLIDDYQQEIVYGKKRIKRNYKKTDAVIAISDSISDYLGEGISKYRIYNGIMTCERYEKEYCNNGQLNICVVGAIRESKNQLDVIKAVKELLDSEINVVLYIVGDARGEYYQFISDYVAKEHLDNNVVFTGYIGNVDELLKNMDIGIIPSDREAFGRVTVEYMANYMAVIGSSTGANRELIDTKYLYPLHNIEEMATIIRRLAGSLQELRNIGYINRNKAEEFSAEKNANKVYDLYGKVIYGRKG